MLSLVNRSAQNTGMVRVDLDVLDALKRSWAVPKNTGKLILPKQQNSKFTDTGVKAPVSQNNNLN